MSKGVYKKTKTHCDNISRGLKGKRKTKKHIDNFKKSMRKKIKAGYNPAKNFGDCKGKNNGMYGKKQSIKSIFWNIMGIISHHIYGKKHEDRLLLLRSDHAKLHYNAGYWYILDTYGKKGVDRYLKWFKKKYHPKLFQKITK